MPILQCVRRQNSIDNASTINDNLDVMIVCRVEGCSPVPRMNLQNFLVRFGIEPVTILVGTSGSSDCDRLSGRLGASSRMPCDDVSLIRSIEIESLFHVIYGQRLMANSLEHIFCVEKRLCRVFLIGVPVFES